MKKLAMHKIIDVPILAYEMDYYQYIPPSHLMRLTSTTAFGALWTYGYSYLDLLNELGATWMMGMVDMHVHKDLSVTREPELISMYASPLYRTPANFMIRVIARHGEEAVGIPSAGYQLVPFPWPFTLGNLCHGGCGCRQEQPHPHLVPFHFCLVVLIVMPGIMPPGSAHFLWPCPGWYR